MRVGVSYGKSAPLPRLVFMGLLQVEMSMSITLSHKTDSLRRHGNLWVRVPSIMLPHR